MESQSQFRNLPSVDKLISDPQIQALRDEFPHEAIVDIARQYIDELRLSLSHGNQCPVFEQIRDTLLSRTTSLGKLSPRPVLNATGVIIHTNLGRSPLSKEALAAMEMSSKGYSNLEIDLDTGKRGSRNVHTEQLLCQLTGADDALVVNNNASAVLLTLSALANRKEVIVSRGHAVEIGGKFRIPDVMKQSGAKLVEIGTTNKTYISDYEQAITPRTGALLRVHSSNFKVIGFAEEVSIQELVNLGIKYDVNVLDDLGSGCLLDVSSFGLDTEPRVQDTIMAGAGLVMFSGDKLLGGPQAGIIAGKQSLIAKLKKHPLARAVRIDKTRLAALSATLIHYLKGDAVEKIPIWRMISASLSEIDERANTLAQRIGDLATAEPGESTIGGGSLPGSVLPTRVIVIRMPRNTKVQDFAHALRSQPLPVVGRVEKNALVLDPRSILPEEDNLLIESVQNAIGEID